MTGGAAVTGRPEAPMDPDIIHIERPKRAPVPSVDSDIDDVNGAVDDQSELRQRSQKRWWAAGAVVILAVAALLLTDGWRTRDDAAPAVTTAAPSTQPPPALSVAVFDTILPSTVTITTGAFDEPVEDDVAVRGLGAGVIVNDDGLILTALHVVDGAGEIEVGYFDGTTSSARVVGVDEANDIAVLAPESLPGIVVPAVLGDAGALRIGDEAYVVGNPVGLVSSMSVGVISGLDRSSAAVGSDIVIDGLIQFDAAVNPGNSGGPLLNRRGEVVGIVTGLVNPSGADSFSGIGFAATIAAAGGGLAPGQ